jgi:hypothetical protein
LRFLQACRVAVDQNPERQNPQAQNVFRYHAKVRDAGQLIGLHVDGGLADGRHAVDGEHTKDNHQQGDKGKTEESTRRDIQVTQGHGWTLG